jgi:hypothetical protein
MAEVVIDTNVLVVADGRHADVSPECVQACTARLNAVRLHSVVVVDDAYRLFGEYQKNLDAKHGKNAGAVFLKWLAQNLANPRHVVQVPLTDDGLDGFAEFPVATLQDKFDPSDRKFAAVANARPAKPPILQAVDSKWLHWCSALAKAGLQVEFVCPDDICRFFASKFPDEPVPALP